MRYLSVCSGIEAASVAWHPLGWGPLAFSEIEPFPRAVLAYHYPDVPLYGDFTKLRDMDFIADADVLVGGTPCQAFSIAGLRKSLDDDRGNLSLEFVRLADAIDDLRHAAGREPAIVVWENVPGVLSVKDNAFGCFLAGLAGDVTPYDPPRGKWTDAGVVAGPSRAVAWRVLDAQYFGLAQRRRRVFVVASAREGFDPAAVLLEWEGVRRDTPPRREAGQGTAQGVEFGPSGGRFTDLNPTLNARAKDGPIRNQLAGAVLTKDWPAELAPTLNASFGEKQGLEDQHIRGGQDCLSPQLSMCLNAGAMGRCDAETETLIPTIGCVFDEASDVSPTLRAGGNATGGTRPPGTDVDTANSLVVTHSLRAEGFDASEDGTGRGTPLVPVAYRTTGNDGVYETGDIVHALTTATDPNSHVLTQPETYPINTEIALRHNALGERTGMGIGDTEDPAFTLQAGHSHAVAVAFSVCPDHCGGDKSGQEVAFVKEIDVSRTLDCTGADVSRKQGGVGVAQHMAVRRLTPRECERLQGFPDGYTAIPWKKKPAADCPDGPRYKALGNSMAVPVMRWIGSRIAEQVK